MKRISIVSMLVGALFLQAGACLAEGQAPAPKENQAKKQTYGSQLMTREERIEHRKRVRAAKTDEDREQIRREHHEKMKERAKERGITLPDKPPAQGGGMGPGGGMRNR